MGKIIFEYQQDSSLSKKNTPSHDLSIHIGMDRFSFLVSDPQQNVIALKSYQYIQDLSPTYSMAAAIRDVVRTDSLLPLNYQSVRIGLDNSKNTLVPQALFMPEQLEVYLKNTTDFPATNHLSHDLVKRLNVRNVFAISEDVIETLLSFFPEAKIFHGQTALLEGFAKLAATLSGHQVFIHVQEKKVQVLAFVGKELLFNNAFPFQSAEDFIYYILLVYHQFDLKPELVPLTISGFLVEDSQIYHLLYRYIRLLNVVQPPDYYRFPEAIKKETLHFYFDLYSLKICE